MKSMNHLEYTKCTQYLLLSTFLFSHTTLRLFLECHSARSQFLHDQKQMSINGYMRGNNLFVYRIICCLYIYNKFCDRAIGMGIYDGVQQGRSTRCIVVSKSSLEQICDRHSYRLVNIYDKHK